MVADGKGSKQAKLMWMGREEEVDRTLALAWHMAPGASWLRRPAAFPYTEVSKLVLWYSSMEEELLPFYRQRKRLRKLSGIFKRAQTAVLVCIRPSVWNQRSPPANNPSWTQHVSVSSAWGLTPRRAVRSAFGVWSLCGMIIVLLSPCSDTWKKFVLTPSVPCHNTQWARRHIVHTLLQPIEGRNTSQEIVTTKFGDLLWKETWKVKRPISQNLFLEHLCSSRHRNTQEKKEKTKPKSCSELGFRGTIYTVICIF